MKEFNLNTMKVFVYIIFWQLMFALPDSIISLTVFAFPFWVAWRSFDSIAKIQDVKIKTKEKVMEREKSSNPSFPIQISMVYFPFLLNFS